MILHEYCCKACTDLMFQQCALYVSAALEQSATLNLYVRSGDWSRAATSSEEIGTNATAPSPSSQEPEPAATAGEQLDGGGSGVRKFGKGLPKGIGAGGMLDKAKKKAEQAAERAKKEAEKAAVGAAAGATAVAARASGKLRATSCFSDEQRCALGPLQAHHRYCAASGPGGTDGMRGVLKKDYTPSFESAIGGSVRCLFQFTAVPTSGFTSRHVCVAGG